MITYQQFIDHLGDPSLAYKDRFTDKIEILRLKNDLGWTVAHAQSMRGWTTNDKDILKWSTIKGYSVAHCQAFHGVVFTSKAINRMATKKGWLPASIRSDGSNTITVDYLLNQVLKIYKHKESQYLKLKLM